MESSPAKIQFKSARKKLKNKQNSACIFGITMLK